MTDSKQTGGGAPGAAPDGMDVFARNGLARATLESVTGRWAPLVLLALAERGRRFGALRERVQGVSDRMLSQTLHLLERDGLVTRGLSDGGTPRVEYALTALGAPFAQRLRELADLCESSAREVATAREAHRSRAAR